MGAPPAIPPVTLAERLFSQVPTLVVVVKTGCCLLEPNTLAGRALTRLLHLRLADNARKSWCIFTDDGVMILAEVENGPQACATALALANDASIADSVEIGWWDSDELILRGYHLPGGGNFGYIVAHLEHWRDYRVKL